MKNFEEMTPIELNVLINKTKVDQENIKSDIYKYLDEVNKLEEKINSKLEEMKKIEDRYVELMGVLMSKK